MEERRSTFLIDQAKFATQKTITYILLGIFIAVTVNVLYVNDQSERSMILQTVINLTLLGVGYWLGSSKGAADSKEAIDKIMKPQSESMSRIAEGAAPGTPKDLTAQDVKVTAAGDVTVTKDP